MIVAVKTGEGKGAESVSLIAVETDRDGFRRGRNLEKIGQHGQDTCELFFDEVRVPQSNLLGGAEGLGFIQLMQQLPQERLILGVIAAAGGYGYMVEYPISRFYADARIQKIYGGTNEIMKLIIGRSL